MKATIGQLQQVIDEFLTRGVKADDLIEINNGPGPLDVGGSKIPYATALRAGTSVRVTREPTPFDVESAREARHAARAFREACAEGRDKPLPEKARVNKR